VVGRAAIRAVLAIGWACAVLTPGVAAAQPSGGFVRGDEATIEILPPTSERELRTPEGWLRIEEGEADDGEAQGSFGTYRPLPEAPSSGQSDAESRAMAPPYAARAVADPCRGHRQRYLLRIMRLAGVQLDRPLDVVEGLTGPAGYRLDPVVVGMLAGADPLRSLAWDSELRSIARDLAACTTGGGAYGP
jgi:hypothetical protein